RPRTSLRPNDFGRMSGTHVDACRELWRPLFVHPAGTGGSFTESLLASVAILAFLAALVGGSRGPLVAPRADTRFDISLVVPAQERFLVLRVRPVTFPAARRAAIRPASEATDADAVPLAKRSHHATRIFTNPIHRSGQHDVERRSAVALTASRPAWTSEILTELRLRGKRWCGAQDLNLHGLAATGS